MTTFPLFFSSFFPSHPFRVKESEKINRGSDTDSAEGQESDGKFRPGSIMMQLSNSRQI